MPYFSIQTNRTIASEALTALGKKASAFIAGQIGKPEAYVMTAIASGVSMTFAGSDGPTAFVEVKSLGLAEDRCNPLAEAISEFIGSELEIEPNRVFIDFVDVARTRFAWNGKTFA